MAYSRWLFYIINNIIIILIISGQLLSQYHHVPNLLTMYASAQDVNTVYISQEIQVRNKRDIEDIFFAMDSLNVNRRDRDRSLLPCDLYNTRLSILYQRRVNSIPTATVSHIQLTTKEDAQTVKDIIQDKDSDKEDEYGRFCTAAKVKSTCKTGKEDLETWGVFTYGDLELPESFNDFVFHDKIGTTLGPVESDFGWHLIFVRERHDPNKRLSKFSKNNATTKNNTKATVTTQELKDQKKKTNYILS